MLAQQARGFGVPTTIFQRRGTKPSGGTKPSQGFQHRDAYMQDALGA